MVSNTKDRLIQNDLVSEELREVVNNRPGWLIKNGNILLSVVLIALFIICWFVRLPNSISITARLKANNLPKIISSKSDSRIIKILVRDKTSVTKGQHVMYLLNDADHDEVIQLHSWLNITYGLVSKGNLTDVFAQPKLSFTQLGELQPAYEEVKRRYEEAKLLLRNSYYQKKHFAIKKDLDNLAAVTQNLEVQKNITKEDEKMQQKEFDAYRALADQKVIAPLELQEYKRRLLSKERNVMQAELQLNINSASIASKKNELLELNKIVDEVKSNFLTELAKLNSLVVKWMDEYILSAPESGRVFLINQWQINQAIDAGQDLFYIQSKQSGYHADVAISHNGLAKVRIGQPVYLSVAGFSEKEFGSIVGLVSYVGGMPNKNDSFLVEVALPNGLRTNRNYDVDFKNYLLAQGRIVTGNSRLLHRVLE